MIITGGGKEGGVRSSHVDVKKGESVPHRGGAVSSHSLLQMVVVWQDLHQEVQLQSLRLQHRNTTLSDKNTTLRYINSTLRQLCGWCRCSTDLRLLALQAAVGATAVHHRVLRHHLAGVELAAGAHDAAAAQHHPPAQVSCRGRS